MIIRGIQLIIPKLTGSRAVAAPPALLHGRVRAEQHRERGGQEAGGWWKAAGIINAVNVAV